MVNFSSFLVSGVKLNDNVNIFPLFYPIIPKRTNTYLKQSLVELLWSY